MTTINNYPIELIERITDILARDHPCSNSAWKTFCHIADETFIRIFKAASKYPGFRIIEADGIWLSTTHQVAVAYNYSCYKMATQLKEARMNIPRLSRFSRAIRNYILDVFPLSFARPEVLLIDWHCFLQGTLPCDITKRYIIAALIGFPIEDIEAFKNIMDIPLVELPYINIPKRIELTPEQIGAIPYKIHIAPDHPPFMVDRDIAKIYGVDIDYLNRQAEKNPDLFPQDIRFQLLQTDAAKYSANRRSSCLPWAYTREGCNILASVLNTTRAFKHSPLVIEAFDKLKQTTSSGDRNMEDIIDIPKADEPPKPLDSHAKESSAIKDQLLPIRFHQDTIYLIDHNGEPFVPMKPIVENLGLDWSGQHAKLKSNPKRWSMEIFPIVAQDGKQREMVSLPIRKFPAFMLSIEPNKVKPEIRHKLELYQEECDQVLWDYWIKGYALNPRQLTAQQGIDRLVNRQVEMEAKLDSLQQNIEQLRIGQQYALTATKGNKDARAALGQELTHIYTRNLYAAEGYSNFGKYCQDKFGINARHAYYLVNEHKKHCNKLYLELKKTRPDLLKGENVPWAKINLLDFLPRGHKKSLIENNCVCLDNKIQLTLDNLLTMPTKELNTLIGELRSIYLPEEDKQIEANRMFQIALEDNIEQCQFFLDDFQATINDLDKKITETNNHIEALQYNIEEKETLLKEIAARSDYIGPKQEAKRIEKQIRNLNLEIEGLERKKKGLYNDLKTMTQLYAEYAEYYNILINISPEEKAHSLQIHNWDYQAALSDIKARKKATPPDKSHNDGCL